MASTERLTGSELIDCARANSSQGIRAAASRCGYGSNIAAFEAALREAGEHIGVDIPSFEDLYDTSAVQPGVIGGEEDPDVPGAL
ncbi:MULTISPECIES: hypothetical protein [unclassified Leptolyngbya]|uniref:hypothetical protein n=1 Tax=unclassified Leptolyngbya TaxID=2650499 RepID=UPI0016822B48|nr:MULTISPECIES: hypothetical protein [unclassified Leptolyngbya]MBD1909975.1 hypothetical protein [Leptolyngbya sp. FACHB-8]MBD2156823.1 hypothetical protein [Leptolyngbya sp. FACHB-16]